MFGIGRCGVGGAWWFHEGRTWLVARCRWHQCGIKVGLCAGRVGAMPLLVLRHGKQGVKRGLMGLQKLQLKTVIIALLCELESRGACVCARACVVQRGAWLVGCVVCSLAL